MLERGDLPVSGKLPVPSRNQLTFASAGPVQLNFASVGPFQLTFASAGPFQLTFVPAGTVQFSAPETQHYPSVHESFLYLKHQSHNIVIHLNIHATSEPL